VTSATDMTQHPDVAEISDLAEGLLSPSRTADVRHHLEGCPLCADVHQSLGEIRGLLGTLPGPPRMPADVVGRIDAALAAEALLNATALDDATHVSRETTFAVGVPGAPAQKSPLTERTGRRPAGHPEDTVGPGRRVHTRRRRGVLLGAFLSTAAVGIIVLLGSLLPSARNSAESSAASSRGSSQKSVASEFSEGRLRGRVDALLASGAASGPMVTPGPMVKGSGDSPNIEGGAPSPREPTRAAAPTCSSCRIRAMRHRSGPTWSTPPVSPERPRSREKSC
jgi:anti-sigma factor RsiW